jgi:hypothetical protein
VSRAVLSPAAQLPVQGTPLQAAFLQVAAGLDALELLDGRSRAVALDLTRRRLTRLLEQNADVLREWDLSVRLAERRRAA